MLGNVSMYVHVHCIPNVCVCMMHCYSISYESKNKAGVPEKKKAKISGTEEG